jgi:hypothetical protein
MAEIPRITWKFYVRHFLDNARLIYGSMLAFEGGHIRIYYFWGSFVVGTKVRKNVLQFQLI